MGNKSSIDEQIYCDFNNRQVRYIHSFQHNPANEAEFVSANDERMRAGDECYLVSTDWLRAWIGYTKIGGNGALVGPIANQCLVDYIDEIAVLKSSAVLGRNFAPVCKAVWEYYFMAYGGGPVIAVKGVGITDVVFMLMS
jgi:hypothetical protein